MIDSGLAVAAQQMVSQGGVASQASGAGGGGNFADLIGMLLGLTACGNATKGQGDDSQGALQGEAKNQLPYWAAMPYTSNEFVPNYAETSAKLPDLKVLDDQLSARQNVAGQQSSTSSELLNLLWQQLTGAPIDAGAVNAQGGSPEWFTNEQLANMVAWLEGNQGLAVGDLGQQQNMDVIKSLLAGYVGQAIELGSQASDSQLTSGQKQQLSAPQMPRELSQLLNTLQLAPELKQLLAAQLNAQPLGPELKTPLNQLQLTPEQKQLLNSQQLTMEQRQLLTAQLNSQQLTPELKQLLNSQQLTPELKQLLAAQLNAQPLELELKTPLNQLQLTPEQRQLLTEQLNNQQLAPELKQLLNQQQLTPEQRQLLAAQLNSQQLTPELKQLLNSQQLAPELKQIISQLLQQSSGQRGGQVGLDQASAVREQYQAALVGQQLTSQTDKAMGQEKSQANAQAQPAQAQVQQVANNLQQNYNPNPGSDNGQQQRQPGVGQEQNFMATASPGVETASGAYKAVATEGAALRTGESTVMAQIARAIIDHVGKDQNGQTNVRLRLHPAELGEVVIRIIYRDGNITTHFQAASEQVKQLIEGSLPQLRETLTDLEFNLKNASVSVGAESREQQQGFNDQNKAPASAHKVNSTEDLSMGDDVEQDDNGLNYLV